MKTTILTLALVACGGGGTTCDDCSYWSTYDDGGGDGPPPPPGTDGDVDCDAVPNIDPDGLDCQELATALYETIEAAYECVDKEDCRALPIPCEDWDAAPGCYAIVNTCVTQNDIEKFHPDAAGATGCDEVVPGFPDTDCECGSPPKVDCVSGVCSEVFDQP